MTFLGAELARPWALLLLVAIPLLVALLLLERRRGGRLLLPTSLLLEAAGRGVLARFAWLPSLAAIAGVALVVVALARPQHAKEVERDLSVEGIDIVVALDLSTSMNAVDFRPNDRITVAKEVLDGFIARRPNDRLGLVVFSGEAFTQCPLTLDHKVLREILGALRTGAITDGTAIGNALGTALNRLRDSDAKTRVVVLITDGDNNAGNISPREAAQIAQELGIKVFTIMVGKICNDPGGCPVPFPAGADMFGRPAYKNVPIPTNPGLLREIASKTGGDFYVATDRESLEGNLEDVLRKLEKSRFFESSKASERDDVFFAWLHPAVLLLLAELALSATLFRKFP